MRQKQEKIHTHEFLCIYFLGTNDNLPHACLFFSSTLHLASITGRCFRTGGLGEGAALSASTSSIKSSPVVGGRGKSLIPLLKCTKGQLNHTIQFYANIQNSAGSCMTDAYS